MNVFDKDSLRREIINQAATKDLLEAQTEKEFWGRVEKVFQETGYTMFMRHFNNFPVRIFWKSGLILGFVDASCSHTDGNKVLPPDIQQYVQAARNSETRAFHESVGLKIVEESARASVKQSIIEGARNELRLRGITDVIFSKKGLPDEFYVGNQQLRQRLDEELVRSVVFDSLRTLVVEHGFPYMQLIS